MRIYGPAVFVSLAPPGVALGQPSSQRTPGHRKARKASNDARVRTSCIEALSLVRMVIMAVLEVGQSMAKTQVVNRVFNP